MPISDSIHQAAEGEKPLPDGQTRVRLGWYLVLLAAGPLLLLIVALFLIPSKQFDELQVEEWMIGMGYGPSLHHADCQVVIIGDSAAMVGLDPFEIERRTGLSTCNIGENAGLLALNGMTVLDQYLQQNTQPKFLVFFFAPEDLDLMSPSDLSRHGLYEGITYRFRQPDRLASFLLVMKHPPNFFHWISAGLDSYLTHIFKSRPSDENLHIRDLHHGQLPIGDPDMESCKDEKVRNTQPNRAWVDSLRTHYGVPGVTILFDAMPLPVCDPSLDYYRNRLPGVVDNPGLTLPVDNYRLGGRHVNAKGSRAISGMVADQILKQQQQGMAGAR